MEDEELDSIGLGVKSAGVATLVTIGKGVSLIVGAIMLVVIARLLGPSQYGIYIISLAVAGFVGAFGNLDVGSYFNKHIPKYRADKSYKKIEMTVGDGLFLVVVIAVLLILIGVATGGTLVQYMFGSDSYTPDIYVGLLSIIASMVYYALYYVNISFGDGKSAAVSAAMCTVFQAVIGIGLVLLGFQAFGALIGYIVGLTTGAALNFYFILRHTKIVFHINGSISRFINILKFSGPLTGSAMINGLINNFSVVFLGLLFVPPSVIGQFGLASKIGILIDLVAGSICMVLISMFATALHHRMNRKSLSNLYNSSVFYSFIFTLPLVVYVSVLSKDMILTVFTSAYNLVILYMPLIGIGILISLFSIYGSTMLISMGKVKKIFEFSLIAGLVQLVPMLFLGSVYGVLGIIFSVFYIWNLILAALYFNELARLNIKLEISPMLRLVAANIISGVILIPLLFWNIRPLYILIVGVILFVLVYPIALAKTRTISSKEIEIMYRVCGEVPLFGEPLKLFIDYTKRFV